MPTALCLGLGLEVYCLGLGLGLGSYCLSLGLGLLSFEVSFLGNPCEYPHKLYIARN